MLTSLLSNFSEEELLGFLSKSSVVFTQKTLSKDSQEDDPAYLNKSMVASAVGSIKAIDFVLNKKCAID